LREAEVDIDGNERNYADQRLDKGAELVMGEKYASDIEILNIYEPATYLSSRGPLSDGEYFMIDNKPITVTALIKNNSNNPAKNVPVTLRIVEEPTSINNQNALLFTQLYDTLYFNNEQGLYSVRPEFANVSDNFQLYFFEETKFVDLAPGEGIFLDFAMDKVFRTY
jgi:hypothetical protein